MKSEYSYERHIFKRYGLSVEQVNEKRKSQSYRCAICRDVFRKTPHIDHCHRTNKVRGLLCVKCNLMLAGADDRLSVLRSGIAYLLKWHKLDKMNDGV